jgi:4a-hydroxytetrahydrobiopterin dehydratase
MTVLSDEAIAEELKELPDWERQGNEIRRTYKRKNFVEAIDFLSQVATIAQKNDHHPNIGINWNKVTLVLSTHSAGGITAADIEMAKRFDTAFDAITA